MYKKGHKQSNTGKTHWNKDNSPSIKWKGKSYEEICGIEKANEIKKKIGIKSKGRISGMKGKKHSEKAKRKIRLGNRGRKVSIKTRRKMRERMKGNKNALGSIRSKTLRKKIGDAQRGEKHWNWIKDRSQLKNDNERNDSSYKEWRYQVFKRDRHICRINNKDCFGKVIAHHILNWSDFPELRYNINNGITLCQAHHPRKRAEEKRLIPFFQELVSVSSE